MGNVSIQVIQEIGKVVELVKYHRTGKIVKRELDKFGVPTSITVVNQGKSL